MYGTTHPQHSTVYHCLFSHSSQGGGLAQMVERSLSMREVPGSMPGSSTFFFSMSFAFFSITNFIEEGNFSGRIEPCPTSQLFKHTEMMINFLQS